jgi:DNA-binding winged helix-turn-helix (wHTH) protein
VPAHTLKKEESSNNAALAGARYACFGSFQLDLKREELFKDGRRIKLQGKVYQILLSLVGKPGAIVTREELRLQLWPAGTHVNYDANVNTTVNKLRQVLSDSPDRPTLVETIPRKGYRFLAEVEYVHRPVTPPAPQPEGPSHATAVHEPPEGKASSFRTAILSRCFDAGVVTLVIAGMLFGAALVLYAHH